MREDKFVRSGADTGMEGTLLRAAKRAKQANDIDAMSAVRDQLEGLHKLSVKDGTIPQFRALQRDVVRILKGGGSSLVMETKAVAQLRPTSISQDDVDEVASSEPLSEISGYGAVFGNEDLGGDIIVRGAFTKTLSDWRWKRGGRLPVMLAVHDSRVFPVGSWTSMVEDDYGLKVTGVIANTARGREANALIHMTPSALDGLSIGYSVAKVDFDRSGTRLLRQIDLYEISLVHLPMNEMARLSLPKTSDFDRALKQLRSAVEGHERDSNVLSFRRTPEPLDDDPDQLVARLRQLAASMRT